MKKRLLVLSLIPFCFLVGCNGETPEEEPITPPEEEISYDCEVAYEGDEAYFGIDQLESLYTKTFKNGFFRNMHYQITQTYHHLNNEQIDESPYKTTNYDVLVENNKEHNLWKISGDEENMDGIIIYDAANIETYISNDSISYHVSEKKYGFGGVCKGVAAWEIKKNFFKDASPESNYKYENLVATVDSHTEGKLKGKSMFVLETNEAKDKVHLKGIQINDIYDTYVIRYTANIISRGDVVINDILPSK